MMHYGYFIISKMAAAFAHCGKFRSLTRLFTSQQNALLSNYINKQVRNECKSFNIVSIRPLCSSTTSENPSNTEPADKLSKKNFDLSFEGYQKLKRKIRSRQRIAGLPVAAVALLTSSAVSAYLNPNMFDAPPDQIQPIM